MYRKIAEYLRITVDGKNGNYIAFFPSYQFMEDVLEEFEKRSSGVELVIQSQFMSENQREEFLEMFEEERDHPMLGFCACFTSDQNFPVLLRELRFSINCIIILHNR